MFSGKRQSTIRTFGKVSKSSACPKFVKPSEEALATSNKLCAPSKRKRDDSDEDAPSTFEVDELAFDKVFAKKPKIRFSTPPPDAASIVAPSPSSAIKRLSLASAEPSRPQRAATPEDLPAQLRDILSIQEHLLHALSLHFAHNGPSAPAEITALCKTITVRWKKRRVTKEDLQRMFAISELAADHQVAISSENTLGHSKSFFKLTTASSYTCLEYVGVGAKKTYRGGMNHNPFNEKCLQALFKADVMSLYLTTKVDHSTRLDFLDGPLSKFPLLRCDVGAQTEQRKAKASAARDEIMDVAKASQIRQNTKPTIKQELGTEDATPEQASQKLKSRTLSLFERVKAKQLANAAQGAATPQTILRQHAIGRISEVVEILRMKQQQKQSTGVNRANDESPSKVKVNKVAFGFAQIIQEIKNSVSIPIQDNEAKMCLELLSNDMEGNWCTMFALGSVKSLVLQGSAKSGVEIQKELESKERVMKALLSTDQSGNGEEMLAYQSPVLHGGCWTENTLR